MVEGVDPYYRFVFLIIWGRSFDVGGVAVVSIDNKLSIGYTFVRHVLMFADRHVYGVEENSVLNVVRLRLGCAERV